MRSNAETVTELCKRHVNTLKDAVGAYPRICECESRSTLPAELDQTVETLTSCVTLMACYFSGYLIISTVNSTTNDTVGNVSWAWKVFSIR